MQGEGISEVGCDKKTGGLLVKIDPKYFRPTEVDILVGDASKAKNVLGWEAKISLKSLLVKWFAWRFKMLTKQKQKYNYGRVLMFPISGKRIWVCGHNGMVGRAVLSAPLKHMIVMF